MPMTKNQVVDLIKLIRSYDNRNLDEAAVTAWAEQAIISGWEADEAFAAVREHFRDSTDWLMPGHINQILRARRRQPATVTELRATGALPQTPHVPPALEVGEQERRQPRTAKKKTSHSPAVVRACALLAATYPDGNYPSLDEWYEELNPPGTEPWPKNVLAVALRLANTVGTDVDTPVSQHVRPIRPKGRKFSEPSAHVKSAANAHLSHMTGFGAA